jgi:hypothetical protein
MSDKRIYEKFFFLQKIKYTSEDIIDELYITYQDEKTGEILLFIEIKDVISVNYLQKFTGCNKEFNDKDLIELIAGISKLFNIYMVIIHPNFKPFSTIIDVKPDEYKYVINNITDSGAIKRLSNDIILYNNDLINYLLTKKERFDLIHIKMNYRKYMLDKLNNIKIEDVFTKENYEIYSIIKKQKLNNLTELILFMYTKHFYMLDKVIYYINIYFDDKLIINKLYYIFDTSNYLFEKNKLNYTIDNSTNDSIMNNYLDKLDIYSVKDKYLR